MSCHRDFGIKPAFNEHNTRNAKNDTDSLCVLVLALLAFVSYFLASVAFTEFVAYTDQINI